MRTPCYQCPDRHPACHDHCPKYQAFHAGRVEQLNSMFATKQAFDDAERVRRGHFDRWEHNHNRR